jgi:hypothetical protein
MRLFDARVPGTSSAATFFEYLDAPPSPPNALEE